jgi:hypothetical protein
MLGRTNTIKLRKNITYNFNIIHDTKLFTRNASIFNKKLEIQFRTWTIKTSNLNEKRKCYDKQIQLYQRNEI